MIGINSMRDIYSIAFQLFLFDLYSVVSLWFMFLSMESNIKILAESSYSYFHCRNMLGTLL